MLTLNKEKYLCKFTTLNKNIITSLYENTLWHSRVDKLNDPFEFYFSFNKNLPKSRQELCKLMHDSNYWVKDKLVNKERDAAIELLSTSRESDLRDGIVQKLTEHENALKNRMQKICVCSLSKSFDEPLMWSHYSEGMRGICLLFDSQCLQESGLVFERVLYNKVPPKVDFFDEYIKYKNQNKIELGNFFLTKHTGWEYEKEYRSVCFNPNESSPEIGTPKTIPKGSLKGIILGSRVSNVDKSILLTLSKELNFKLFIAYANNEKYKVDIKEI
jgi:hypothetical protein